MICASVRFQPDTLWFLFVVKISDGSKFGKRIKSCYWTGRLYIMRLLIINQFGKPANNLYSIQLTGATKVFWNDSGHVIDYGGYIYKELLWISIKLNFRYMIFEK